MRYPALDVSRGDVELVLAAVDEYGPTAAEERDHLLTIFFSDSARRDHARDALTRLWPELLISPRDVDDEDWARRSQENLAPITVGRVTIVPAPSALPALPTLTIVIVPSMGFGTGHHATTRLCLEILQRIPLTHRSVLDVGTGSGILAITARLLGARSVVGIDYDADALQSARGNLDMNPGAAGVRFEQGDAASLYLPPSDIVVANLTGATLQRMSSGLERTVNPGGLLILSGILRDERDAVLSAFPNQQRAWEGAEDEWLAVLLQAPS